MDIFSDKALKGKHVLITGATGGIGYETAKVTAAMGAKVSVTGRNELKLEELMGELKKVAQEENLFMKAADITKEGDRLELIKECRDKFGPVTHLVNSAGIAGGSVVRELEENKMRDIMELNYFATVRLTQLVYEGMMEQTKAGGGAIVNVSSLSGLRGTYGNSAYAASKFAITGFTQSFAVEAIEHNIRVNAVCPGFVDTDMGINAIKRKAGRESKSFEEKMKEVESGIPSGRITTAREVANTIAFLLTDAAENIVGESVKISGGSVM
ncbi:SDR family NAD(P)-dependent oxidoreductase [Evansella clarkii]|uniref:SDR family NAD(P)-dependent oxidoreductase n=1 Tax=Evansella clarkii TaxID=79879 RepID=UPI0009987523|nr:SDR family oxidoreductase [Evansella clarkii]